jgi:hypothetical protein
MLADLKSCQSACQALCNLPQIPPQIPSQTPSLSSKKRTFSSTQLIRTVFPLKRARQPDRDPLKDDTCSGYYSGNDEPYDPMDQENPLTMGLSSIFSIDDNKYYHNLCDIANGRKPSGANPETDNFSFLKSSNYVCNKFEDALEWSDDRLLNVGDVNDVETLVEWVKHVFDRLPRDMRALAIIELGNDTFIDCVQPQNDISNLGITCMMYANKINGKYSFMVSEYAISKQILIAYDIRRHAAALDISFSEVMDTKYDYKKNKDMVYELEMVLDKKLNTSHTINDEWVAIHDFIRSKQDGVNRHLFIIDASRGMVEPEYDKKSLENLHYGRMLKQGLTGGEFHICTGGSGHIQSVIFVEISDTAHTYAYYPSSKAEFLHYAYGNQARDIPDMVDVGLNASFSKLSTGRTYKKARHTRRKGKPDNRRKGKSDNRRKKQIPKSEVKAKSKPAHPPCQRCSKPHAQPCCAVYCKTHGKWNASGRCSSCKIR